MLEKRVSGKKKREKVKRNENAIDRSIGASYQLAEQRERRRKRSKIEDSSTERKVEDVRQNVEEEDTKMDESKETGEK